MCTDVRTDMCTDVRTDMCTDTCRDMCTDTCRDMCTDMVDYGDLCPRVLGVVEDRHACGIKKNEQGRGVASSARHHQGDGPALSLGHLGMGTEQCVVVVWLVVSLMFSNMKLWSRGFRVGLRISTDGVVGIGVGDGIAPVNRGTTGSDRERWLTDTKCH